MEALSPRVVVGVLVALSLLLCLRPPALGDEFSQRSAYAILETLVNDIGPRPMGSPAEQRALEFAVSKFAEYGCDEAYVMAMRKAGGVNTKSGNAIGIKKGKTGRIIVIGGHIDTSGPEVPGANDDGSGVACVMELARVLCIREMESTLVFACWGGEEAGLRGSRYFVDAFEGIDSVVLMLQIDMADGAGVLIADPLSRKSYAPRWLPREVFEVFYGQLNHEGLVYYTHSGTLNGTTGLTGSDHVPFLEKGIPAIDFTSDVSHPIHSPQDNLENFDPSGLKRSGDLVLKLVERFDSGVPPEQGERYKAVQLGRTLLFVDYWMLWVFIGVAGGCSFVVTYLLRRRHIPVEHQRRVKWSGLKLLLFTVITQILIWNSETLVGLIRGTRFPWVNNFAGFLILGILFGLIGVWLVLQIARRLPLSTAVYPLYVRSATLLFLMTLLLGFASPELAVYPAWALLFMSLAVVAPPVVLKLIFFFVAPYLMIRLVFNEEVGLIHRGLSQISPDSVMGSILYNGVFVVLFSFLSLPFVYGFVALYRSSNTDLLGLKYFARSKRAIGVLSLGAITLMIFLLTQPVYNERWFSKVNVDQRFTMGEDSSLITLKGSEYLKGIELNEAGDKRFLDSRATFHKFEPAHQSSVAWCMVHRTSTVMDPTSASDTSRELLREVVIHSVIRPYSVAIQYTSSLPLTIESEWHSGGMRRFDRDADNRKTFSWYAFPDTPLVVPVRFVLREGQQVAERIEVTYDTLSYPLGLRRDYTNFFVRTAVTSQDTFGISTGSKELAEMFQ